MRRQKDREQLRFRQWIRENENNGEQKVTCGNGAAFQPRLLFILLQMGKMPVNAAARKRLFRANGKPYRDRMAAVVSTLEGLEEVLAESSADYVVFLTEADWCDLKGWSKLTVTDRTTDMIYGDEDMISLRSRERFSPFFKPDWSPELFFCDRYTGQACAYRRERCLKVLADVEKRAAGFLYELALRYTEGMPADRILHFPYILNHRIAEHAEEIAPDEQSAIDRIKEEALRRRGIRGHIEPVADMPLSRVVYEQGGTPKVSIVVPSKDNVGLLTACMDSLEKNTDYANREIVLVDNGSSPENRERIDAYCRVHSIQYVYEPMPFNFARMCNLGAEHAKGEFLLFLNDDIEVIQPDWLGRMAGQAALPHTGAVGAKLYYPGGRIIQHAGVINVGMGPSHALLGKDDAEVYYYGRNRLDYNCLAVTAACLMVQTAKFRQVGGFDESLAVAFNDVDLCMKLHEAGYDNVIRNDVCLIHHESASRGLDSRDEKKMRRLIEERTLLWEKHPCYAKGIDPYYSVNLAPDCTDFSCRLSGNTLLPAKMAGTIKHPGRYESPFQVHIDEVVRDGDCIVRGWYYWKSDKAMAGVRPCLALSGENGEAVCDEACKVERRDVAEALGVEWQECGFSCRLPGDTGKRIEKGAKIGILLKTAGWRKKLNWSDYISTKEDI